MTTTTSQWGEPDGTASFDMNETLTAASLAIPKLPPWAKSHLRRANQGWVWGTDGLLSPWAVYSLLGEAVPPLLPSLLEAERPDFWLFGHTGYGVNSCALGLVMRWGPLFIAQQHFWGGGFPGPQDTEYVNDATTTWNSTVTSLDGVDDGRLRVAVLFSSLRGYAELWIRDDTSSVSMGGISLPHWSRLWAQGRLDTDVAGLFDLHFHDDTIVAIGAGHLLALVTPMVTP